MSQVQLIDHDLLTTLAAQAEAGETVTLLRGDKPIAQIVPFPTESPSDEERQAALAELRNIMNHGYDLSGMRVISCDELYDRD